MVFVLIFGLITCGVYGDPLWKYVEDETAADSPMKVTGNLTII